MGNSESPAVLIVVAILLIVAALLLTGLFLRFRRSFPAPAVASLVLGVLFLASGVVTLVSL